MASIVIQVLSIGPYDAVSTDVFYTGIARCSGMTSDDASISWNLQLDPASLATAINDAIKTTAIAAAAAAGITVGALDKKTLVGAAADL